MTGDHRARRARRHFEAIIRVHNQVIETCIPEILRATDLIVSAFRSKKSLLIIGNGGSAADSQHMAAELAGRLTMAYDRPGLPALALTTDTSFLTAYANDIGYEGIFERQVEALGRPGDVLLGISTSGKSRNIIRAVEFAKMHGLGTISLTGEGGALAGMVDVGIRVPGESTATIQEAHITIEHVICDLVERELFGYEEQAS